VLGQCSSLADLDLSENDIGHEAQEMFTTLQQHCTVLF
jgi:Ran GTPase-activating protein (RanGAP) involved in mRNA processing and transport